MPVKSAQTPEEAPRRRRRDEDGFNLVYLAVTVTLLNIWIAAMLPLWSHQILRNKEADLIFRGLQIAEGIRVYLARTGQYPTSLKQMMEHQPRCLRKIWPNPLREDGRWALVPVGTGGAGRQGQPGQGPNGRNNGAQPGQPGQQPGQPGQPGQQAGAILSERIGEDAGLGIGDQPQTVAFRGVYHPDGDEATRLFLDSDIVSDWRFTVELVSALRQGTPEAPLANPRPFRIEQIGRPFPPGVVPPVAMPGPDAQGAPQSGDGSGHVVPPGGEGRPGVTPPPNRPGNRNPSGP